MIYKTHLALNILLLQSILNLSNIPYQNILTPWGIGIIAGTTLGSFISDIDAPQSEISKRFLPAKTILNILIPIITLILSISIYYFLNNFLNFKNFQVRSLSFMLTFSILLSLMALIFNKILKPLFVHRGFFHSILGLIFIDFLLSTIYITNIKHLPSNFINIYNGFYIGINIGYIGHMIGDLFTYHGIRPLFPFPWRISLKILKTNSVEEKLLFYILLLANIFIFSKNILK